MTFPDDGFWNSRTSLREIKDYAVSRLVSPDAVLAVTLCRIIVATPPHVALPSTIGSDYGSLNFGVVILGNPGSGKDAAFGAAKALASIRRVEDARRFFMVPVEYLLAGSGGHQCSVRTARAGGGQVQIGVQVPSCHAQIFRSV